MTIEQVQQTISNWINSCETHEQLNLCRDAIERFIVERFKNHVTALVMSVVLDELDKEIVNKRALICTPLLSGQLVFESGVY